MDEISTSWIAAYWAGLFVSGTIGAIYFRDLGDVTQIVLNVKRKDMVRFIRHEYKLLGIAAVAYLVSAYAYFGQGAGGPTSFWIITAILLLFFGFTWVWVHIGLRHQQKRAKYFSIEEAKPFVAPANSVIVIENNGEARAHPDYELWRPHLAGSEEGLGGDNIIMTYCSMTNLGMGYKPEIEDKKLDLEVLAQHGNNLIMRDNTTGEPIQQLYGTRERDGRKGPKMQEWPTFRMSFYGFEKAYPDGKVFINVPSKNPLIWLVDFFVNFAFSWGIHKQGLYEKPIMDNLSHSDSRLPAKVNVWGFNVGDDYVCYTKEFVIENDNLINTKVGGRDVVISYAPIMDSVGVYYNDTGKAVTQIDFFGESDQGKLTRMEALKAGIFWHVWVNYFQDTAVNRIA
jgi:hypothetical protein